MSTANTPGDRAAIVVRDLVKTFPRRRSAGEILRHPFHRPERIKALSGVSLTLQRGGLLALLGPNGAGKTTLLKVLCGLVLPQDGHAEVLGVTVGSPALPSVLGLVHGDERSFYWRLTARENLSFYARLYGLRSGERQRRVAVLLERVRLDADADRRFADFSSGMKQRLAIARALLADPPVLLMDEPTRSLDPVSAAELRGWIRDDLHVGSGKTILIATHNLREAETLCDTIAVLARGRMRALATPAELRRKGVGGVVYRLRLRGRPPEQFRVAEVLERRDGGDGTTSIEVRIGRDEDLDPLLAELRDAGAAVLHCAPHEPDLEQIFHQIVGDEPAARGSS
ncbi:MAG: ABC transporter ATP-binding protein [Acidobacteriota bacterium]|nr:ABC transporter ATP-binding protein [Acidobacteriota bacterium]